MSASRAVAAPHLQPGLTDLPSCDARPKQSDGRIQPGRPHRPEYSPVMSRPDWCALRMCDALYSISVRMRRSSQCVQAGVRNCHDACGNEIAVAAIL